MTVEILFSEVCNLFGDTKNVQYLKQTLPQAEFIETALTDTPYFANAAPDLIYIGGMTENTQRRVIAKLFPLKGRLQALIDAGTVILATGNAGEVFMKHISYVTERIETDGLGLVDLTVKTNLFDRFNGKVLGRFEDMDIVGFKSQFSFVYGDNEKNPFVRVQRGIGYNRKSKLEGVRINNFFCTSLLGPLLPNNPLFTEYLLKLAGADTPAAFRKEAMAAYEQRLKEFRDPTTKF
ncbi:MAG: hypothetical protein IJT27_09945 [Clostridia bacterium]|nr:hypothetical protein [Clostridia bacterium]